MLKNEISASALGNSLFSDSDPAGSIFDIVWKKKKVEEGSDDFKEEEQEDMMDIDFDMATSVENSMLKDNILYYISGFIVRKIIAKINCLDCKESLLVETHEHSYTSRGEHANLVNLKNLGGLVHVSQDVFRVVQLSEKVFFMAVDLNVLGKDKYLM